MLRAAGHPVSALGIVEVYRGLVDGMVIDSQDSALRPLLERRGIAVATVDIRMDTMARSVAVARTALALADEIRRH
jgi:hypothetical protein